jgi:LysM repeat protein
VEPETTAVEPETTELEPPAEAEAEAEVEPVVEPEPAGNQTAAEADAPSGLVPITHRVRPGEFLSRIAARYGVTQGQIMEWNALDDPNIRYGIDLTIYVPEGTVEFLDEQPAEAEAPPAPAPQPDETRRIEHEVQPGEFLSRLAQRYGVTQQEILEWNALDDPNLRYGTTLVIYVPEDAPLPEPAPEPEAEPAADPVAEPEAEPAS